MRKERREIYIYIAIAFVFSLLVHLIWVFMHHGEAAYMWNGQLMINTNDGYYFASGVKKSLYDMYQYNHMVPSFLERGLVFVTFIIVKFLHIPLNTVMLYLPTIISSLIVIPLILIGKLYNKPLWGFFSALLASVAWSYYNRTLAGYYDTDMFALIMPYFILYYFLKSLKSFSIKDIFIASIFIVAYSFLYPHGSSVTNALIFIFTIYMLIFHRKNEKIYIFLTILFISASHIPTPIIYEVIIKTILLSIAYLLFTKKSFNIKALIYISAIVFLYFLISSNALASIISRVISYTSTGTTKDGSIHFYGVLQTVSEASGIPFFPDPRNPYANNVSYRIIGSVAGFFMFIIGYVILCIRKKEFILALPLVGIGLFAHWGGLRFTIYAVPIAALSAIYLLGLISEYIQSKKLQYTFLILATIALIYPNVKHALEGYNPGPVFQNAEVKDLNSLKKLSNPKDYTLTWWDYGYPIWYYSETNTLIDGGKHNNDNFIISKLFLSTSPQFAANLARLSVEKYAKTYSIHKKYEDDIINAPKEFVMQDKKGKKYIQPSGNAIIDMLLQINKPNQKDPNKFLQDLASNNYKLPKKTRDIYFYAPLKMLNIFPVVAKFSNIDLKTGKRERNIWFYPTYAYKKDGSLIIFRNGIAFDTLKGNLILNNRELPLKYFIETKIENNGDIKVTPNKYHEDGRYILLYIKNLNRFIVMDNQTFASNYVQMFLLGNYDKNLFDLVVKSPYSRVYKLKK